MIRTMIRLAMVALLLTAVAGCSRDEAEKATKSMEETAKSAGSAAENMAGNLAEKAGDMADHAGHKMDEAGNRVNDMASDAVDAAHSAAAGVAGSAVEACRSFAEQEAWGQALEVCKKAHEMMPDDLALEHAYQQAQAAAR